MQLMRVGGAALNQTPLDWDGNAVRIRAAIEAAKETGVAVLCCPELAISGYGCEDAFLSPATSRTAAELLLDLEAATSGIAVAVGLPVWCEGGLYDAAALLVDGRLVGMVAKQHLAGEGIHYEPRWFHRWPRGRRSHVEIGGRRVPFGDLRFDCGGVRIGFEICEDAWSADRPAGALAGRGIDILLNPSASHFAFGKDEVRRRFVLEGSRACGAVYVYANLLGNEAGRAIYDGGVLVAAAGAVVAAGRRFSWGDLALTESVVDLDRLRLTQARLGLPNAVVVDDLVETGFSLPPAALTAGFGGTADRRDAWERSGSAGTIKAEEFTRAVALGLFDVLRKTAARGFVVSASGGADSSAVACLAAIAIRLSVAELGLAETVHRIGLDVVADEGDLIRHVLRCVYQSTANSGAVTRAAARDLSSGLGATFHLFDVEPAVTFYETTVEQALGRPLDWQRDDVARQNIQARVRSPGVWMLANLTGSLLLATSNRSEVAVGYATMDGDTSGGFAPLAGIDKAFIRRWLNWLERVGPEGLGPIPALAAINAQVPTAELRPAAAGQTDENDLMPYEVLDTIERYAIRDQQPPLDVWRQICGDFPGYTAAGLAAWTERFFLLWSRNQWKRERYAPSFHLDDENLDPKTWCRFPILSGGFRRELRQLRAAVMAEGGDPG
jgi:NAD+ synthase (glutamine-hydrolysing)